MQMTVPRSFKFKNGVLSYSRIRGSSASDKKDLHLFQFLPLRKWNVSIGKYDPIVERKTSSGGEEEVHIKLVRKSERQGQGENSYTFVFRGSAEKRQIDSIRFIDAYSDHLKFSCDDPANFDPNGHQPCC